MLGCRLQECAMGDECPQGSSHHYIQWVELHSIRRRRLCGADMVNFKAAHQPDINPSEDSKQSAWRRYVHPQHYIFGLP